MSLVAALIARLGSERVVIADDVKAGFELDFTGRYHGVAACVVRPRSTAEVTTAIEVCAMFKAPVIVQGGRTGLVGASVPRPGVEAQVILSTTKLDQIGKVDRLAGQITCGAGVTLAQLADAARVHGLRYGVDFSARDAATVGGMLATNAGGHNVLAFGSTRAQVLGVEAVLPNGEAVSRLAGLDKDNSGYDLAGLLVGSEGTLAVITAARLRLRPAPRSTVTVLMTMSSIAACVDAVSVLRALVPNLVAAELMLKSGVELVCAATGLPEIPVKWGEAAMLIEAEGGDDDLVVAVLAEAVEALDGVVDAAVAVSATERGRLWAYRDRHAEAVATLGIPHKLDVSLPLAEIAGFIESLEPLVAPHRVVVWGHVGDGNLHVNIVGPAPDDDTTDDKVLRTVVERSGSISAEHGIGAAKASKLTWTRTAAEIGAMRAIKRSLDPTGIMNPGVLFP